MIVHDLYPKPLAKAQFKLLYYKEVPKYAGCYVLTTFDDEIIYIGLAVNLYNRFKQHLDNPEKVSPNTFGKAVWFYYQAYDSSNLPKLERSWLNQYLNIHGKLPSLNKVFSPIN